MTSRRARFESLLVCLLVLQPAAARSSVSEPAATPLRPAAALRIERLGRAVERGAVSALARDPSGSRIAVGDTRRVVVHAGADATTWLARGPVTALAFAAEGALLVGLEDGLLRCEAPFACRDATPAPGSASRNVRELAAVAGCLAVATEDGAFVSTDGTRWSRVGGRVPLGPATSIALQRESNDLVLWIAVRDALWRVALQSDGAALSVRDAQATHPFDGEPGELVHVSVDGAGRALVVGVNALARERSDGRFELLRPALPPGAAVVRAVAADHAWVATDRGLLVASDLVAPFERVSAPAGSEPGLALLVVADGVVVGTTAGAFRVHTTAAETSSLAPPVLPDDPPVQAVMRVALRWLDIGPGRMQRLQRGVERRALWPELSVALSRDVVNEASQTADESFVSGDIRHLFDRDRSRGAQLGASVALRWELGDLDYHPESIDVSKETREVIELRDDVLDEITQLYFERRRALIDRAVLPPDRVGDRLRLALRADELAAGLDAWTGGWFTRHAAPLVP